MAIISIQLMGTPSILRNGEIISLRYRKVEATIYYLAIKKNVTRDELIHLLYQDHDIKIARSRLRDILYNIRDFFGSDFIQTTGHSLISLNLKHDIDIDIDHITDDNILTLGKGEFLENFYVKNCLAFDQWLEQSRQEWKNRYLAAIYQSIKTCKKNDNMSIITENMDAMLNFDSYNEVLYREFMKYYSSTGNYNQAISIYNKLAAALSDELDEIPELETDELLDKILKMKHKKSEANAKKMSYFYGRKQEMTSISENFSQETKADCRSILVMGEAGVGKTALLQQIQNQLSTTQYLIIQCSCYYAEKGFRLKAMYDILSHIVNQLQNELDTPLYSNSEILARLSPYLSDTSYQEGNAGRLSIEAQGILGDLESQLKGRKILLMLEDVQWIDTPSLRLLSSLLLNTSKNSIIMLGSCRDDIEKSIFTLHFQLEQRQRLRIIKLPPFDLSETTSIVRDCLKNQQSSDSETMAKNIYRETEGNALFLMETIKVVQNKGEYCTDLPRCTNIIQERLLDLATDQRNILRIVALFFDHASLEQLQLCTKIKGIELFDSIEPLLNKNLLIEELVGSSIYYKFTHKKIRGHVYQSLSAGWRKVMYDRIIIHYESIYRIRNDFALCSKLMHYSKECGNEAKWCEYRLEYLMHCYSFYHETFPYKSRTFDEMSFFGEDIANDSALIALSEDINRLYLNDVSIAHLRMKVDYLLGRWYIRQGTYREGVYAIERSLQHACTTKNTNFIWDNCKQMIYYGIQINDTITMHRYLNLGLTVLSKEHTPYEYYLYLRLQAVLLMKESKYTDAKDRLIELMDCVTQAPSGLPSIQNFLAVCYNYIGECLLELSQLEKAYGYFLRAIKSCAPEQTTSGMGIFYCSAGKTSYQLADFVTSRDYIQKSKTSFEQSQAFWGYATALAYSALLLLQSGEKKQAEDECDKALEYAKKIKNPSEIQLIESILQTIADSI